MTQDYSDLMVIWHTPAIWAERPPATQLIILTYIVDFSAKPSRPSLLGLIAFKSPAPLRIRVRTICKPATVDLVLYVYPSDVACAKSSNAARWSCFSAMAAKGGDGKPRIRETPLRDLW
jgi:hypothetical protein